MNKELHILPPNRSLQVKEIAEVFLYTTNYIRILFTREKAQGTKQSLAGLFPGSQNTEQYLDEKYIIDHPTSNDY